MDFSLPKSPGYKSSGRNFKSWVRNLKIFRLFGDLRFRDVTVYIFEFSNSLRENEKPKVFGENSTDFK